MHPPIPPAHYHWHIKVGTVSSSISMQHACMQLCASCSAVRMHVMHARDTIGVYKVCQNMHVCVHMHGCHDAYRHECVHLSKHAARP